MYRESLGLKGGLEKPLHEVVKVQPWFPKRLQDSRDARTMGFLLKKRYIHRKQLAQKEGCMCYRHQSWRNGAGDVLLLKSFAFMKIPTGVPDCRELKDLAFALLDLGLDLVQAFFTMPQFSLWGMGMFILSQYIACFFFFLILFYRRHCEETFLNVLGFLKM